MGAIDTLAEQIEKKESDIYTRVLRLQKAVYAGICIAFLLSTICLLSVAWSVYHSNHQLKEAVDTSNQALSCFVEGQFDRSVKGLPANSYFKDHPDQLQAALDSIAAQRGEARKVWGVCRATTTATGGTSQ